MSLVGEMDASCAQMQEDEIEVLEVSLVSCFRYRLELTHRSVNLP